MGKKILLLVLSAVFIFSMKVNVNATDINSNGGTASVPVKYTVNNTAFIITVPTVIWAQKEAVVFEVTASEMNLRPDEKIQVFLSEGCNSNSQIVLQRQGASVGTESSLETIATVAGKKVSDNNFRVGLFKDSANSTENLDGKVTLSGVNVDRNTKAGDYQTTVQFKVELSANGN